MDDDAAAPVRLVTPELLADEADALAAEAVTTTTDVDVGVTVAALAASEAARTEAALAAEIAARPVAVEVALATIGGSEDTAPVDPPPAPPMSAPMPHGMASPPGCVANAGASCWPEAVVTATADG